MNDRYTGIGPEKDKSVDLYSSQPVFNLSYDIRPLLAF